MFDRSPADSPASFGVGNVIPGWVEGLQLMVEGEKRRIWIPAKLAYGEQPAMPGAPAGDLVFDVELLEIIKPPETPKDLTSPPKDAKKTESGLVYRVLKKGTGTTHPGPKSRVSVHYSGWSKDGKLFDSSLGRGAPASFYLNGVIKGWTEGLQLMVEGEKARLWIPAALAYGDKPARPGAPAGDLVFDVELLSIQ
jgi:peptidylprolyl isomerase